MAGSNLGQQLGMHWECEMENQWVWMQGHWLDDNVVFLQVFIE